MGHSNLQTYLSGYVNPDLEIYLGDNDRKALELIQNSYLLKTQTRHVCLRWVHVDHLKDTLEEQLEEELEVWEIDNLERTNTNLNIVMNCLKTRFQNAITLDIVCDEIWFEDSIWRKWREGGKNDSQILQLGTQRWGV